MMAQMILGAIAAAFFAASAIVTVVMINAVRGARPMGAKKPFVAFVPKYQATIRLPSAVTDAANPGQALEEEVAALGFKPAPCVQGTLRFMRGSLLGDFSINLTKVSLTFHLPLSGETECEVAYRAGALFDTGDLWRFAGELKDKLESTES